MPQVGERGLIGSPLTRAVAPIANYHARDPTPSPIPYLSSVRYHIDFRRSCCLGSADSWEMGHFAHPPIMILVGGRDQGMLLEADRSEISQLAGAGSFVTRGSAVQLGYVV